MNTIEKDITEILYNLRRIRRKKHLSQKDVAEKMGTTQQVVSKIENGNPSIRTFYAYCRAIGVIWYKNEGAKYERKEILWNIKKDINPKQNSKNF